MPHPNTAPRVDDANITAHQIVFPEIDVAEVAPIRVRTDIGPDDVLVRTSHIGICGSDVAALTGRHPWFQPPLVTGHEVTAVVHDAGTAVTALTPGDHVLLNPLVGCGECQRCRQGRPNQCATAVVEGFKLPGAAATWLVRPASRLHRLPDDLDLAEATLAEPLAAAWRAATRWDELDRVAVIGAGSIGQLVLAALRHRGAGEIVVIEPVESKRELASALGMTAIAPGQAPTPASFTAVFDCVSSQDTVNWAAEHTEGGGAIVSVGVPDAERTIPLPRTQRYEIAMLGSGLYTPEDVDTAIDLVARGYIDLRRLISAIYPLAEAAAAYEQARTRDAVKILIEMN